MPCVQRLEVSFTARARGDLGWEARDLGFGTFDGGAEKRRAKTTVGVGICVLRPAPAWACAG